MFRAARKLKEPNSVEHGYNYALFLLNLRLRTEGEMRQKMNQRGYASVVVDEVVGQLLTEKLLNDSLYAEIYLENLKQYKNYGFFMIKKKLMERRLPKELIEAKLTELLPLEEELKIAKRFVAKELDLAKRKGVSLKVKSDKSKPLTDRQTLARKFQTRGFRSDVVRQAIF